MKGSLFLLTLLAVLISQCASRYHAVYPPGLHYQNATASDSLEFSYHFDVVGEAGNKKYSKYERKSNLKMVAVRIVNHTGRTLRLDQDISFYQGSRMIFPIIPSVVKDKMGQTVPIYLLYLLLTPMTLNTGGGSGPAGSTQGESIPIGYLLGPGIAIGNMLNAGSANKHFEEEMNQYGLSRVIEDDKTLYALVCFYGITFDPLQIKVKTQ